MDSSAILKNAIMHEIEKGTQRSVGALYGIMLLADPHNSMTYQPVNRAIMDRWPTGGAAGALDRIKKIGWDLANTATSLNCTSEKPE